MTINTVMFVLLMFEHLCRSYGASLPVFSLAEVDDQVNVSCASEEWSQKPSLIWRDKGGRELANSFDQYRTDSKRLVSVSSWLLSSPSDSEWISCSLRSADGTIKEGRVMPFISSTARDAAKWRALIVSLVISLCMLIIMAVLIIPKIRDHISRKSQEAKLAEEQENLVGPGIDMQETEIEEPETPETVDQETNTEKEFTDWEYMLACKVAIRPDASTSRLVEVGKDGSRITRKSNKSDDTEFVHILCQERLRTGQYYWVITALTEAPHKKIGTYKCPTSWYVGVTNVPLPQEYDTAKINKFPLTPENDFWVLHYEAEIGYYVYDPSMSPVVVKQCFSKLGVFLDCDNHKLSFYDFDKHTHLYTFYNVDSRLPLTPVLSPGDKPQETIIICQENGLKPCNESYPLYEPSAGAQN
ncbi:butyrophilin subfamily 3 member A3-like [Hoplias malabaricus]|uniref:butyrophilin subfamily 3 member A3-like n=1 Tax=Hoplias malabaricus TaxID=27720 RepID=UPI003461E5E8